MPDTGLPWSLPYPTLSDEADAPKYIGQLATATDTALDSLQASIPVIPTDTVVPYRMAAGTASIPAAGAANTGASLAITFPVGRFTQPPVVVGSADSNGYGAGGAAGPTNTGVTLRYYNPTASVHSNCKVHWVAVQMTAGSAPG